jgi:hypothetical protein
VIKSDIEIKRFNIDLSKIEKTNVSNELIIYAPNIKPKASAINKIRDLKFDKLLLGKAFNNPSIDEIEM